ncbi:MAG: enoyl-CoA hydratase/isomerase family protein [Roseovarius sp.]|nr:enoyl-CoA hydratase/isomerase family protein [Roseovarius sp.]
MIGTQIHDGYAAVTLRVAPANAFDENLLAALDAAFEQFRAAGCSVVMFESGLSVFSAGANLKVMADTVKTAAGAEEMLDMVRGMHAFFDRLEASPFINVAKIRGAAVGGGCEFALACDFRIGSEKASIGLPEVRLGLIPGAGGTQRLPRMIGEAAARRLILTGQVLSAQEALDRGMLDELHEDGELDDAVRSKCEKLARLPAHALIAAKRCILASRKGFEAGMAREIEETRALFNDPLTHDLVDDFLQRTGS